MSVIEKTKRDFIVFRTLTSHPVEPRTDSGDGKDPHHPSSLYVRPRSHLFCVSSGTLGIYSINQSIPFTSVWLYYFSISCNILDSDWIFKDFYALRRPSSVNPGSACALRAVYTTLE